VSRRPARVRINARTRAFCFLALLVTTAAAPPTPAADLRLPASTIARITAVCPECDATGWIACGSQDVAWGRGFAQHALLGTPKRGYLIALAMTGDEFRSLARRTAYPTLEPALRRQFYRARLVILEDQFADARAAPPPRELSVTFPEPLHKCVHGSFRSWGCCVGKCQEEECCEKSLGSPTVDVVWKDGDETLTLHYSHTVGVSWLERRQGAASVRYACLVDAKGKLGASDAK
jgi:hypothetical protein